MLGISVEVFHSWEAMALICLFKWVCGLPWYQLRSPIEIKGRCF